MTSSPAGGHASEGQGMPVTGLERILGMAGNETGDFAWTWGFHAISVFVACVPERAVFSLQR